MYAQEGLFWVKLTFNQKSLFLVLKLSKVVASSDLSAKRESSNSNNKIYISYLSSLTFTQMHNFQLITGWYSIDDK